MHMHMCMQNAAGDLGGKPLEAARTVLEACLLYWKPAYRIGSLLAVLEA